MQCFLLSLQVRMLSVFYFLKVFSLLCLLFLFLLSYFFLLACFVYFRDVSPMPGDYTEGWLMGGWLNSWGHTLRGSRRTPWFRGVVPNCQYLLGKLLTSGHSLLCCWGLWLPHQLPASWTQRLGKAAGDPTVQNWARRLISRFASCVRFSSQLGLVLAGPNPPPQGAFWILLGRREGRPHPPGRLSYPCHSPTWHCDFKGTWCF